MVSFTHEQNSFCSQQKLNDIAHEHTIICRQLFAGQVVGSWPMKRKKHLHRMIKFIIINIHNDDADAGDDDDADQVDEDDETMAITKYIRKKLQYRKVPKISPGLIFFKGPF